MFARTYCRTAGWPYRLMWQATGQVALTLTIPNLSRGHITMTRHTGNRNKLTVCFSKFFAKKFATEGITVNSCHPGDVNSKLSNELGFGGHESPVEGASTPVWLATSPDLKAFQESTLNICRKYPVLFQKILL